MEPDRDIHTDKIIWRANPTARLKYVLDFAENIITAFVIGYLFSLTGSWTAFLFLLNINVLKRK